MELLFCKLDLTPAEQADVRRASQDSGTQVAAMKCLKLWQRHTPSEATYEQLLNILLSPGVERVDTAEKICCFLIEQNSEFIR